MAEGGRLPCCYDVKEAPGLLPRNKGSTHMCDIKDPHLVSDDEVTRCSAFIPSYHKGIEKPAKSTRCPCASWNAYRCVLFNTIYHTFH
jgi:hypothetical protein